MSSRIGRFEIQAEIGKGGFGKVFRAFDPVMNRVVAIKELTATEDVGSFTRFKNEAISAGNLHHENIVIVHEFGQEGNKPFIVMEHLDGQDLKHVLENGPPLSLYRKVRIMDKVADGLYCAHCHGVFHRDIKPANIMVLKDGAVKIMDFGIARLRDNVNSVTLTQEGFLIGTVGYMAPELLSGGGHEFDGQCDIWSYAVMFYELLAGRNPFQAGNMAAQMNRILNEEPPPLASDICPLELQNVVGRLLRKPREARYQSLEDARFDLQPILKDLERSEVDRILSRARELQLAQQWQEALDAAREARRIDPQNGTARVIYERAQTELARESVRPKIDIHVRRSNASVEQGKLDDAIVQLDMALRLDPANATVLSRIQELKALKGRQDEAGRLLKEAEQAFRDKQLTKAFEHVSDAMELDRENPKAQQLWASIQSEIEIREAERVVEASIAKARGRMAVDDLDGALQILQAANSQHPGRAPVVDLLARLEARIAERKRREDRNRRLQRAKELVNESQFEQAIGDLEKLRESFPNDLEVSDLLTYARQELEAKAKSDAVKRIKDTAEAASRGQRFQEAIQILEEGLGKYPDDLQLVRQLRSTHSDRQAFEKERALEDGLAQCQALCQQANWTEALDLIGRLAAEFPNNRDVLDRQQTILDEKNRQERLAAIRKAGETADRMLKAGKTDTAVGILESAILKVGAERDLTTRLEKAKAAQRAEREQQKIESELKHAQGFEDQGDITTALQIINEALIQSPRSQELLQARERLNANQKEVHRRYQVAQEVDAVQETINRKQWREARELIAEKTKVFGLESAFTRLEDERRRGEEEHIAELVREGRRLLNLGQVVDAQNFVADNLIDYRELPEVKSLGADIVAEKRRRENIRNEEAQRAALVAECLGNARNREQQGDLAGASRALQPGLDRYPQDPDLRAASERVKEKIAIANRGQVLSRIRQVLDRSDWTQALELIEQARQGYSNDPGLIPLQAEALDQRRGFLESAATTIRAKLAEGKPDVARTLFDQTLAAHREESVVRTVGEEIGAAESMRETERQRRDFIAGNLQQAAVCESRGDLRGAMAILQKALQKYSGERELLEASNRVQAAIDRSEQDRKLAAAIAPIKRDLDRGKWQDALKLVEEARAAFPENGAEFARFEQQAREQRDREIQALADKGRGFLKLNNLAEVDKLLAKQLAPFAGEPQVVTLANSLKEARLREGLIQKARAHTADRRFEDAEKAINELAALRAGDPEESPLRSALAAAREQERKDKLYGSGREEGDQLLRNQQYGAAIQKFEYLLTQFPGDRQLKRDLEGAVAAEQRSKEVTAQRTGLVIAKSAPQTPKWIYPAAGMALLVAAAAYWFWPRAADIRVSPDELHLVIQAGTSAHAPVTVTGSSKVKAPRPGVPWLTVTRSGSGADKTEFTVEASAARLAPGEYSTDLPFAADKKVHVDLVVNGVEASHFDVQPASLEFINVKGSIAAQKIVVESSSDIPDPKAGARWLTFTRNGVTHDNGGPHKAEFLVSVVANALAPGSNTTDLIFPDKRIPVVVTGAGQAPQTLEVHPGSLGFSDARGQMRATVLAISPQAIPDPTASEKWVHVTRVNLAGAKGVFNAQFQVDVSANGLQPGKTYAASLNFQQQKSVRIELVLAAPKTLPPSPFEVHPTELSFIYNRVKPPEPRTFEASGPPDIADPQTKATWFTLTRAGTEGNKVRFSVQVPAPDKLAPGEHHDELDFPQYQKRVRVNLEVYDPPQPYCASEGRSLFNPSGEGPSDVLVIKGSSAHGAGHVTPALPTCGIEVDASKLPSGVTVGENPSQDNNFTLHLRNASSGPLPVFQIYWKKK